MKKSTSQRILGWAGKAVGCAVGKEVACMDHARGRSSAVRLRRPLTTGVSEEEGDKLVADVRGQLLP